MGKKNMGKFPGLRAVNENDQGPSAPSILSEADMMELQLANEFLQTKSREVHIAQVYHSAISNRILTVYQFNPDTDDIDDHGRIKRNVRPPHSNVQPNLPPTVVNKRPVEPEDSEDEPDA